jgi:ParB family chromosome partitioning protein
VIKEVDDETALEITLVENIQREDLNPVEEARAYQRLMDEFHLTQEEVAARTGKERTTIANAVRLLRLEEQVLDLIEDGRLSPGHGRALLAITDPKLRITVSLRAARGGMTVRQLERLATRKARAALHPPVAAQIDPNTKAALEELQRVLGTRVTLHEPSKTRPGELVIEYYDTAQLNGIYDRLMHQ